MPVLTVIGDGQLARMMQTEAVELGLSLRLLAGSKDASAAQVMADIVIGDYLVHDDVMEVAAGSTAITFDHEHVPTEYLNELVAKGYAVHPGPQALLYAQDKNEMRAKLAGLGLRVPRFAEVTSAEHMREIYRTLLTDGNVCVKAARGGYDGKGVWFPADVEEAVEITENLLANDTAVLVEEKLELTRELSAMVARNADGDIATWPVVESVQEDGICVTAVAPAPNLDPELAKEAQAIARTVAEKLDVTGVMAVELFCFRDQDGKEAVAINELAMRPHNTGHWTQHGSITSQFEQHIRACLNWPLGDPGLAARYTCMVNTLGADTNPEMPMPQRMAEVWRRFPQAKIHLYGKDYRPGRKMGHVIMTTDSDDYEQLVRDTTAAAHFIVNATWDDQ